MGEIPSAARLSTAGADPLGKESCGMDPEIVPGDRVAWNTSPGRTSGNAVMKLTSKTQIKGYTAKGSKDDPQYRGERQDRREGSPQTREFKKR
jgi:Hypervirulence associated proteins TUDOR domain